MRSSWICLRLRRASAIATLSAWRVMVAVLASALNGVSQDGPSSGSPSDGSPLATDTHYVFRFVQDGQPMEGIRIVISRESLWGEAVSDADGMLRVSSPLGLHLQPDNRIPKGWRLPREVFGFDRSRVHTLEIPHGHSIRGHITPPKPELETPNENTLRYCVEPAYADYRGGYGRVTPTFGSTPFDPKTGKFRIDNIAPGSFLWIRPLGARSPGDEVRWTVYDDADLGLVQLLSPPSHNQSVLFREGFRTTPPTNAGSANPKKPLSRIAIDIEVVAPPHAEIQFLVGDGGGGQRPIPHKIAPNHYRLRTGPNRYRLEFLPGTSRIQAYAVNWGVSKIHNVEIPELAGSGGIDRTRTMHVVPFPEREVVVVSSQGVPVHGQRVRVSAKSAKKHADPESDEGPWLLPQGLWLSRKTDARGRVRFPWPNHVPAVLRLLDQSVVETRECTFTEAHSQEQIDLPAYGTARFVLEQGNAACMTIEARRLSLDADMAQARPDESLEKNKTDLEPGPISLELKASSKITQHQLPVGRWQLQLHSRKYSQGPEWSDSPVELRVRDGETTTVAFHAPPGICIQGRIFSGGSVTREKSTIRLWPAGERPEMTRTPSPRHWSSSSHRRTHDYVFRILDVPVGRYWIQATRDNAPPSRIYELDIVDPNTTLVRDLHFGTTRIEGQIDLDGFPGVRLKNWCRNRFLTVYLLDPRLEHFNLFEHLSSVVAETIELPAIVTRFGAIVEHRGHFTMNGVPPGDWLLILGTIDSHFATKRITVEPETRNGQAIVHVPWTAETR